MLLTFIHLFGLHQESKLNRAPTADIEYLIKLVARGQKDEAEKSFVILILEPHLVNATNGPKCESPNQALSMVQHVPEHVQTQDIVGPGLGAMSKKGRSCTHRLL